MSPATTRLRDRWHRVPVAWRRALVATAALWAVVLVVTLVAAVMVRAGPAIDVAAAPGFAGRAAPPTDVGGLAALRHALVRFDALWYLAIAEDWYPATTTVHPAAAFLPAYPGLVAAVGVLTGGRLVLAAAFVSTLATVVALAGVHELAAAVSSSPARADATARRAVVATVLFPTSFFLLAPYAESLHLAGVVWALVATVRARTGTAAGAATLASAARPVGVLLALPLLLLPAGSPRGDDHRGWVVARRLLPATGAVAGLLAVFALGLTTYGDPLAPLTAQANWQRATASPVTTVANAIRFAGPAGGEFRANYALDLAVAATAVATVVAVLVIALRRRDDARRVLLALSAHGVVTVGAWLLQPFPPRPLLSVPRFALVVPAVLVGSALVTASRPARLAWWVVSSGLLLIHLTLFSRWWFVF